MDAIQVICTDYLFTQPPHCFGSIHNDDVIENGDAIMSFRDGSGGRYAILSMNEMAFDSVEEWDSFAAAVRERIAGTIRAKGGK